MYNADTILYNIITIIKNYMTTEEHNITRTSN